MFLLKSIGGVIYQYMTLRKTFDADFLKYQMKIKLFKMEGDRWIVISEISQ